MFNKDNNKDKDNNNDFSKLRKHIKIYEENISKKVFEAIASSTSMEYPAIIVEVTDRITKEDLLLLDKVVDLSSENEYSLYIKIGRLNYIGNINYTALNLNILLSTFKGSNIYLMEDEVNGYTIDKDILLSSIVIK